MVFWDFLMFDQIFLSLQVTNFQVTKQGETIRIYELHYDFPNDLRLRILGL